MVEGMGKVGKAWEEMTLDERAAALRDFEEAGYGRPAARMGYKDRCFLAVYAGCGIVGIAAGIVLALMIIGSHFTGALLVAPVIADIAVFLAGITYAGFAVSLVREHLAER